MNIFYLHSDPKTCAQYHVDRHVVSQIKEYAQLLSTTHRLIDGKQSVALYQIREKSKQVLVVYMMRKREIDEVINKHVNQICRSRSANSHLL